MLPQSRNAFEGFLQAMEPAIQPTVSSAPVVGNQQAALQSKPERQRHTVQQWDDQKPFILDLLRTHTYEDVVRILWEERKFKVQYETAPYLQDVGLSWPS